MRALRTVKKTSAVLTTSVVGAAFVLAASVAVATAVSAQQQPASQQRGAFSVEANPFRGSVGYSRLASTNWELGGSLGFGFPQLDVTLFRGKVDDFRDYAHIAAFGRRKFGSRAVLELGGRLGVADYQRCQVSDCWPRLYFGPSVLLAVGGEHVKVGPRFTFGEISSASGDLDVFASVSPINLFLSWRF